MDFSFEVYSCSLSMLVLTRHRVCGSTVLLLRSTSMLVLMVCSMYTISTAVGVSVGVGLGDEKCSAAVELQV